MSKTYDDAILILNNNSYDCIFVDNMMSKNNGLKLAEYIRKSPIEKTQRTPIILCTAFTGLQSILNARDAGITEILAKPISPEQIMDKMSNAIFKERSFIVSGIYFGPDRRRRIRDIEGAEDRRQANIPLPTEKQLTQDNQEGDD